MSDYPHISHFLAKLQTIDSPFDFSAFDEMVGFDDNMFDFLMGTKPEVTLALTQALHKQLPGSKIFVVRDYMDEPVQFALLWTPNDMLLCSSGFSSPGDLVRDCSCRSVEDCTGTVVSADAVHYLHSYPKVEDEALLATFNQMLERISWVCSINR
ncbi:MAG: hypothetical protein RSG77_17020 [Hafnia sp.]